MNDRIFQCLIVDDEPPAREVIRRYITQLPMLQVAGECANAVEAMVTLQQRSIDILFLDIQMPRMSGLDLIKSLRTSPKIILTTAFEEYALQAFDLDVTDYLLKPIAFERFVKAVMKALPGEHQHSGAGTFHGDLAERPFMYFRADRKMVKVYLDSIYFIESLKDYIRIRTNEGDIVTKQSMAALEVILPAQKFIRVHRSYIVAVDKVKAFTSESLDVAVDSIPVGKLYRLQVMKLLEG